MLEQEHEPQSGGLWKALIIGAVVIVLAGLAFVVVGRLMAPAPKPAETTPAPKTEAPKAAPAPVAEKAPEPEAATPRPRRTRPKAEPAPAPAPAPAAPAGPTLVIESDVPGASVFVNREYLGTTPVRTTAVKPGRHQLNASADGQDGLAETIDVAESGETTVTLRFKDVRLDATLSALHKHGMGGQCDGRLRATPAGLRYETTNTKDAFTMSFAQLEVFEIDYLKKELKIKQRGGKTWNFTDRNENADKLFIFHRDVTKAREKIAAQSR